MRNNRLTRSKGGRITRMMAVRRARRAVSSKSTPVPTLEAPYQGQDMETGRAIVRAWLSQVDGIVVMPDGAHFQRQGITVAIIADAELTHALERGVALGLTSHPHPTE